MLLGRPARRRRGQLRRCPRRFHRRGRAAATATARRVGRVVIGRPPGRRRPGWRATAAAAAARRIVRVGIARPPGRTVAATTATTRRVIGVRVRRAARRAVATTTAATRRIVRVRVRRAAGRAVATTTAAIRRIGRIGVTRPLRAGRGGAAAAIARLVARIAVGQPAATTARLDALRRSPAGRGGSATQAGDPKSQQPPPQLLIFIHVGADLLRNDFTIMASQRRPTQAASP